MNLISILFLSLIVILNLYLYRSTKNKIDLYNQIPPFIWLDYTNSEWQNSNSKVKYLFDNKKETYWRKEKESPKEWDLELELRLTHTFQNGKFIPKNFRALKIIPCEPHVWKWELFLQEAINVDKVLRLPVPKPILSSNYESWEKEKNIPVPSLDLKPTFGFDENLYILGLRLKAKELGACISEIQILEN